jgi:hypothetical protein
VSKDEFVEVDLELRLAHPVLGSDQPLLEVSNSAIGKWDSRLRPFTEFGSQGLSAGNMFEPRVRETLKALEAIRVNSRAGRDVLVEEGDDGLAFEIWDHFHSDAARASAALFYGNQNQRCPSPLELSASAETSLLAANPSFINFYLAVQRLPSYIHHRPAELVKQHPCGLVTGQTELPLYEQGRNPTLVGGHQIGGPEPLGERNLGPVKNRPGCQRDLVTAARTLPPSLTHQVVCSPVSASGADEAVWPAAGRKILFAGFLGGEVALKLAQGLRKQRSGHPATLTIGVC